MSRACIEHGEDVRNDSERPSSTASADRNGRVGMRFILALAAAPLLFAAARRRRRRTGSGPARAWASPSRALPWRISRRATRRLRSRWPRCSATWCATTSTYSGILDLVSKSFYPTQVPSAPAELNYQAWSGAPVSAQFLAFGNLTATRQRPGDSGLVLRRAQHVRARRWSGRVYHGEATEAQIRAVRAPVCRRDHRPAFRRRCRESPARRSPSSATAAATRKSGPWITTAQISTSSPRCTRSRSRRAGRPTPRASPSPATRPAGAILSAQICMYSTLTEQADLLAALSRHQ